MKNSLFILIAFLFFFSKSNAQEHQISAGMGTGTTTQILDIFTEIGTGFSSIFFGSPYVGNTSNSGEYRISYAYTPKEKWHFGAAFSYRATKSDVFQKKENYIKIGKRTNNYYTLAGETAFSFLNKEKVRLYALVGAGATIGTSNRKSIESGAKSSETDAFFNFQVTPFGVSYGKQFGGFAELGFGYRGLFSFGVYYRM